MKFNLNEELKDRLSDDIRVGDVYPAKGGRNASVYWVVIATGDSRDWNSVKVLGLDKEGAIVQATSYNAHSLRERPRVGFVRGLEELEFDVEPEN